MWMARRQFCGVVELFDIAKPFVAKERLCASDLLARQKFGVYDV